MLTVLPCLWTHLQILNAEVRTSASLAARPLQCLCCVSGVWVWAGVGVWGSVRACVVVTACPASCPLAVSLLRGSHRYVLQTMPHPHSACSARFGFWGCGCVSGVWVWGWGFVTACALRLVCAISVCRGPNLCVAGSAALAVLVLCFWGLG